MVVEFDCLVDRCFVCVVVRDDNNSVFVYMQIFIIDDQLIIYRGVKNVIEINCFFLDNIY